MRRPKDNDVIAWGEFIPPIAYAFHSHTSGRDEERPVWSRAFAQIRDLVRDGVFRVVEEIWWDETGEWEIILFDRGEVPSEEILAAIDNSDFSCWELLDQDSDLGFLHVETSIFFKIDMTTGQFELVLPEGLAGVYSVAGDVLATGEMKPMSTVRFEWWYLGHREQEIGYGGELERYPGRTTR